MIKSLVPHGMSKTFCAGSKSPLNTVCKIIISKSYVTSFKLAIEFNSS